MKVFIKRFVIYKKDREKMFLFQQQKLRNVNFFFFR